MLAEPIALPIAKRRVRDPWTHLLGTLAALGDDKGQLVSHCEKPWASITFAGSRHTLHYAFTGVEAVAAGEQFIAELPDHEFAIPRQLVADAAVVAVDHQLLPEPRLEVTAELLLVED